MAGSTWRCKTHAISLSTSYQALLQITAPTNIGVMLKSIKISFSNLSPDPHDIKYDRSHTTAGVGTSNAPVFIDEQHDHTVQAAGAVPGASPQAR